MQTLAMEFKKTLSRHKTPPTNRLDLDPIVNICAASSIQVNRVLGSKDRFYKARRKAPYLGRLTNRAVETRLRVSTALVLENQG
jgi:hypothetical protein